jgi:stage II sporulation SpoE-like protein
MLPRLLAPAIKTIARVCGRPASLFNSGLPGKSHLLGAVLLMLSASAASAQTFSLITGSNSAISLSGLWRFHTGDNPAWADPNFDDSQWPLIHSGDSWTEQGYPAFNGYAWYRFKLEVPSNGGPVDLLLTGFVNGYQVYADGNLIGSAGSAVATRDPVAQSPATTFRLPESVKGAQSIEIALRVWTYQPLASWSGAGSVEEGSAAGDPNLISALLRSDRWDLLLYFVNEYAGGLFAGLVGLAILALFLLRTYDKEYLWFSILLLAQFASLPFHIMMNLGSLPFPLWYLLAEAFEALGAVAAMTFFSIILHRRRSFVWWTILLLLGTSPLSVALMYLQWAKVGVAFAIEAACIAPAYAWVIAVLLLGTIRRDVSARLLVAPVTLFYGLDLFDFVSRIVWQLSGSRSLPTIDATLIRWPFPTSLEDVVEFVFILALLIFLVRRFSLARKEEERLAAEFEAAKTVQSLLIPAAPPATPGFSVENAYLPAQEVGGDFFQVLPDDDGSLLIVVGDVSGKGLKAAMTVSAIVGALRGCALRKPADVLAYLNRTMRGQVTGFFTCFAALINPDGRVTTANAGHLPPYLNGEELPVDPALPLGIADEAGYSETTYEFGPNDRLVFISDGVVEARDGSGELYGFARTQVISSQPAHAIAEAARQFGQEDDITVLSVTRTVSLNPAPA